jgi:hypothetical protein
MELMKLIIDEVTCENIAEELRDLGLRVVSSPALKFRMPSNDYERNLEYCFFLTAILFDTRGLDGTMNGEELCGSDYFFAATTKKTKEDPEFFTPPRMRRITTEGLDAVFSPDGKPENTLIRRSEERVEILHDLAEKLLDKYDGSVSGLLKLTEGYLTRPDKLGVFDLLKEFKGYEDPHFKKGFLLLMIYDKYDLFRVKDRENLFVPVDYHLQRVALRSGIVRVADKNLEKKLKNREAVDEKDEYEIRDHVKRSYKIVERSSGIETFDLNQIFWNLGRSCCHYSYDPRCGECPKTHCSFEQSLDYKCEGRCPIANACVASREVEMRKLFEPTIKTTYY